MGHCTCLYASNPCLYVLVCTSKRDFVPVRIVKVFDCEIQSACVYKFADLTVVSQHATKHALDFCSTTYAQESSAICGSCLLSRGPLFSILWIVAISKCLHVSVLTIWKERVLPTFAPHFPLEWQSPSFLALQGNTLWWIMVFPKCIYFLHMYHTQGRPSTSIYETSTAGDRRHDLNPKISLSRHFRPYSRKTFWPHEDKWVIQWFRHCSQNSALQYFESQSGFTRWSARVHRHAITNAHA